MVLVPRAQIPSTEPGVSLRVDYWWPTACLQLQRTAFSWARITLLSPSPPQPLLRGTCSQWLTERQVQEVSPWFQDGRKYMVQFTLQSSAWTHIEANLQMSPWPCFPSHFPHFPSPEGSPFINHLCKHPCLRLYSSKPNRRPMTSAKRVNDKSNGTGLIHFGFCHSSCDGVPFCWHIYHCGEKTPGQTALKKEEKEDMVISQAINPTEAL